MVQAGWLELLALTWLTRPGELSYGAGTSASSSSPR
jgi:hypothetical protein